MNMYAKLALAISLSFFIQIWETASNSNDVYSMQSNRVDCKFDPKVIKNGKCSLKLVRNSSNLINSSGEFLHPQHKVSVNMSIFYRFNFVYKFFAINFTTNVCDEIGWAKPYYKPDLHTSIFYDTFKQYTDLIRPCPYQNNFSVNNLRADAFRFPPFVPAGDYRMDLRFIGEEVFGLVQAYVNVKAKGLHTLKMG